MRIKIKVFGKLTEIIGDPVLELTSTADTDTLKAVLIAQHPALNGMTFFIAVDSKIVTGNALIPQDAVVALLPPFSGG